MITHMGPETHMGQSGHDPLKIFRKGGVCENSLGGDMHSHERLLIIITITTAVQCDNDLQTQS